MFLEPTNKDDLANDKVSTSNDNTLDTNVTNDNSSNKSVNSIPTTQFTISTFSTNHSNESPTSHALSSNLQTNDHEDDESVTSADLVTMFEDMSLEEDVEKLDEDINEKVKHYQHGQLML